MYFPRQRLKRFTFFCQIVKRLKNEIITFKYYSKQDNVAPSPPHNNIFIELDFNVKFPLLCLLQF